MAPKRGWPPWRRLPGLQIELTAQAPPATSASEQRSDSATTRPVVPPMQAPQSSTGLRPMWRKADHPQVGSHFAHFHPVIAVVPCAIPRRRSLDAQRAARPHDLWPVYANADVLRHCQRHERHGRSLPGEHAASATVSAPETRIAVNSVTTATPAMARVALTTVSLRRIAV